VIPMTVRLFFLTISLVLVWWLWAVEYRRYRVLVLKNFLFEARDTLFHAAEKGTLSFDDAAYGLTRIVINGMLRQAEAFSLSHFVMMGLTHFWWSNAHLDAQFFKRFGAARAKLTPEGQEVITEIMDRVHLSIVSHVLHISILFALPLQVVKLWRSRRAVTSAIMENNPVRRSLVTLDASAHLVGDLESEQVFAAAA
jgi:hypothetical protein